MKNINGEEIVRCGNFTVTEAKKMLQFGKFVWRKICELYASLAHICRRVKLEKNRTECDT